MNNSGLQLQQVHHHMVIQAKNSWCLSKSGSLNSPHSNYILYLTTKFIWKWLKITSFILSFWTLQTSLQNRSMIRCNGKVWSILYIPFLFLKNFAQVKMVFFYMNWHDMDIHTLQDTIFAHAHSSVPFIWNDMCTTSCFRIHHHPLVYSGNFFFNIRNHLDQIKSKDFKDKKKIVYGSFYIHWCEQRQKIVKKKYLGILNFKSKQVWTQNVSPVYVALTL